MNKALSLLKQYFGYDEFRPLQRDIIQSLTENRDVLVLMPTGGGKSLCYQLPALMRDGLTIVISPLIALMKDQVEALVENGIAAVCLNSSQDYAKEALIINQCRNGEVKLLYISPEKAVTMKHTLSDFPVSLIAIDEAHCISSWGHDFRPEYQQLHFLRELFPHLPLIALTATADKITRRDIIAQLKLHQPVIYISSFDRKNLSLTVKANVAEKNKITEISALIKKYKNDTGIIYCTSRKSTEILAGKLQLLGFKAGYYHAGMTYEDRNIIQEKFIKDELQVICATIAFGMGIDKSNVRYVIHYNLPKNLEGYYQEIGRAGRDGLPSETILYYSLKDITMLRSFAEESGQRELNLEKLHLMQQYAESYVCRRKILLNYFSEEMQHNCGNCDVCLSPPVYFEGTQIAQKALSAISRTNERVGFIMLINILRGSRVAELQDKGYDKLKTYGAGKEFSFEIWQYYLMQLLQNGLIEIAYDEGHTLKITEFGNRVLHGGSNIFLAVYKEKEKIPNEEIPSKEPEIISYKKLFEKLRLLRRMIADSEGVAPYIVFSDATLNAMCIDMPTSAGEFLKISGVSIKKMEKYGAEFIKEIKNYLKEEPPIPENQKEELISKDILTTYIDEMRKKQLEISPQRLCYILTGSTSATIGPLEMSLSYYGKLKGIVKQKTLLEFLHQKEIPNTLIYAEPDLPEFFRKTTFNHLKEEAIKVIKQVIAELPSEKPATTHTIVELRKKHKRAHEPWTKAEINIFEKAIEQTNDLELLSGLMQRSVRSIVAAYLTNKKSKLVANEGEEVYLAYGD